MEEILIQIYEWFFGNPHGVVMAEPLSALAVAGIGAGINLISGLFGGGAAKRRERRAMAEKRRLEGKLDSLEKSRQAITNPYAGVSDISSMAKDLSGMVSNPYASLGVATQAAEIQIEEADIALANTLDTLRATGASAGGATALAQAALQSKKGVSASIEQQEAQNEIRRAQGESSLQQLKMQEAQRIQNIGMSEAQRLQQADVAGKQFVFSATERRQGEQLDRVSAQISGAQKQAAQASADRAAISSSMISGLGNIAGSLMTSGTLGAKAPVDTTFGTPGFSDSIFTPSLPSYDLSLNTGATGPSIGGNVSGLDLSNYIKN